jgi:1-acyl-sn-glycerol-3-phosphate acyltransferase
MVFVAKSEVRAWPGIGWLARATDTMFVQREARRDAAAQAHEVAMRLRKGQRLALFPEGTSTDNQRVLTFRSTLLAGLLRPDVRDGIQVQPVTLSYGAPPGEDRRFLAWYGNADFGPHALAVLSARRTGSVRVTFHPPLPVEGRDRKSLAAQAEAAVRSAL